MFQLTACCMWFPSTGNSWDSRRRRNQVLKSWYAVYFPTGPAVQQQEEQMDCGAATPDSSEDATLSQVNKWCQTDRALSGLQGWRYNVQCSTLCAFLLGCIKWRGGFEWGGEGQTKGRATQSQEEGEHTKIQPLKIVCDALLSSKVYYAMYDGWSLRFSDV